MKKTVVLLFVAILMLSFDASAKGGKGLINFGIKGGLTAEGISLVGGGRHGNFDLSTSRRTGFHVGIMSRVNLAMFHIQPELLYNRSSYTLYADREAAPAIHSNTRVKISTVELPVLFGLRLLWFRFQAGPMFNIMTDTSSGSHPSVDILKPAVSFLLGVGVDIKNINLDIRYHGQFKRPTQTIIMENELNYDYRSKFRRWMFSIGYMF